MAEKKPDQLTRGGRLLALRKAKGLVQQDIGDLCGTTRAAVSNWERDTADPGIDYLEILADRLEVDLAWLRHGHGKAPDLSVPVRRGRRRLISLESAVNYYAGRWSDSPIHQRNLGMVKELAIGLGADKPLKMDGKKTEDPWRIPNRYLAETFRTIAANLIVVRVIHDVKDLDIRRGDHVVVDIKKTEPVPGNIVIVDDDGIVSLKRVKIRNKIQDENIKGRVILHIRAV